jgi:hypothetical protein
MTLHNPNPSRKPNQDHIAMLERRKKVAARYLRGATQWEIARAFEVDQATISRDLRAIQEDWLAEAKFDFGKLTARELAKVDEVERQAWAAWAKSQEDAEIRRAKLRGKGADAKQESEHIRRGQAGDKGFLELVLRCIQQRWELLGLDKFEGGANDEADRGLVEIVSQAQREVDGWERPTGEGPDRGDEETPPVDSAGGSAGGSV